MYTVSMVALHCLVAECLLSGYTFRLHFVVFLHYVALLQCVIRLPSNRSLQNLCSIHV